MLDFLIISTRCPKHGVVEIYPKFIIKKSDDLMIRGGDFYAIWVEEKGLWSQDEQDVIRLVDQEIDIFISENKDKFVGDSVRVLHMWDSGSGIIDIWHRYCQKQLRDNFHMLDEKIIFSNTPVSKKDYASKRLDYPLKKGKTEAYNKLMSVLYSENERRKIEWAVGAIVTGASKDIQKFAVLYGSAGTGKSTVLNIIQQLFPGYFSVFDAKALGSSNNAFALESFKDNPLVAIQHDGDLSHIEDNTRLNSLVSHELMTVNEKFKSAYSTRFKAFLFMGTNKPVKITDAKSGLIRRLIDITPTGNKIPTEEYQSLVRRIPFELSGIAWHCRDIFNAAPHLYDAYIPTAMMGASNDFYNYILDAYPVFLREDSVSLKAAWERYKQYCDEAKVAYPYSQRMFKEELKNYFREFDERVTNADGARIRSFYRGFRTERIDISGMSDERKQPPTEQSADIFGAGWLSFSCEKSILDDIYADCPAQYADNDKPVLKWANVKTSLKDIDTTKTHYVKPPAKHIVIDLDIPDKSGNKSLEKNLKAAAEFPPTYAELSNSGRGIHLHYIYGGDEATLSRVFSEHIEIKIFSGNSSLRRRVTKCNDIPIADISSGLPVKGYKKMTDKANITNEKALRTLIKKNLNKEYHADTTSSINFINKALNDIYSSGKPYDVSDLYNSVMAFAAGSTHQSDYCMKLVDKMPFKSELPGKNIDIRGDDCRPLIFFDVEVFPNLFVLCWKKEGGDNPVVKLINPSSADILKLIDFKLVGFNNRRYDNHILYGRLLGYDNEQLYILSQKIINEGKGFFGEAYNLSYADIYDFSSLKQSLKKFEISLGIHHQELGLPWNEPVPADIWDAVSDYCANDVIATEAVFEDRKADFTARKILADVAGMSVNDTTNSLTARIMFGKNRTPQAAFNYRDMGDEKAIDIFKTNEMLSSIFGNSAIDISASFDKNGRPVFPGYSFEGGKSIYRDEEVGEGGYVYSEPGIYWDVALLDIASMHPSSVVAENLFGEYTERFNDILQARLAIKHKDFAKAKKMLGGALARYLDDENKADELAQALKIVINSVYGLTSAKFDNPFRDIRNKDNIVAKRGALFMINLKHEVQKRGYKVAHIKTDSIKIPNADIDIIKFVQNYGRIYGYSFEHEATYDRMCLVNDAVYIAKYSTPEQIEKLYGQDYLQQSVDICKKNVKHPNEWTATGTQFAVPYVFKTLFSKEPLIFEDKCETKSVSTALYLDMNEDSPDLHKYRFVGKVGSFCPIKSGKGGGLLVREAKDKEGNTKYDSVSGAKDYRWLEAELVKTLEKEDDIDISFYTKLVDDAVAAIDVFGDFEGFVSNKRPLIFNTDWPPEDFFPHGMTCGRPNCIDCPNFTCDEFHVDCKLGYDIYPF